LSSETLVNHHEGTETEREEASRKPERILRKEKKGKGKKSVNVTCGNSRRKGIAEGDSKSGREHQNEKARKSSKEIDDFKGGTGSNPPRGGRVKRKFGRRG